MSRMKSQRSVKELAELKKRYPGLYCYADPDDYVEAFMRYREFDDYDESVRFSDYVHADIYPYYYGFSDETDEEFTKRLRRQTALRYSKRGIHLSHFDSAGEFVRSALDQMAGDDASYSAACADLYDQMAWYFEKKIIPVDRNA